MSIFSEIFRISPRLREISAKKCAFELIFSHRIFICHPSQICQPENDRQVVFEIGRVKKTMQKKIYNNTKGNAGTRRDEAVPRLWATCFSKKIFPEQKHQPQKTDDPQDSAIKPKGQINIMRMRRRPFEIWRIIFLIL